MLGIAIIAAAVGFFLGIRFSVIALALLVLTITIDFAVGICGGGSPLVVALQLLATLTSVQISYLVGGLFAAHLPTRLQTPSDSKQMRHLHGLPTRAAVRRGAI
jgi:uncharacterized membrane protein YccC